MSLSVFVAMPVAGTTSSVHAKRDKATQSGTPPALNPHYCGPALSPTLGHGDCHIDIHGCGKEHHRHFCNQAQLACRTKHMKRKPW
jgi:hypothetical protein